MIRRYVCENGNDIAIKAFESFFDAKLYAEKEDAVKEIFEYKESENNIECIGCVWKR